MFTKKNIAITIIALTLFVITVTMTICNTSLLKTWQIITFLSGAFVFFILTVIFKLKHKTILWKLFILLLTVLAIVTVFLIIIKKFNALEIFSSIASFRDFIISTGPFGMIIYVLVQFLQAMFIPIPAMIIILAGVAIYGPLTATLLCTTGVICASFCSFTIGRVLGKKVVSWLIGESIVNKYATILDEKGRFFLIIAFLLPLFPDDALCLVAGITNMKFKTFALIACITRPIGILFMSFFGGGYIIPFTGWGLFVWPFILAGIIYLVIYTYKNQESLESKIYKMLGRQVNR